jgi:hypothetical protein
MLADRIGIMRETALSTLNKEDNGAGKESDSEGDWAAVFCKGVLKPL